LLQVVRRRLYGDFQRFDILAGRCRDASPVLVERGLRAFKIGLRLGQQASRRVQRRGRDAAEAEKSLLGIIGLLGRVEGRLRRLDLQRQPGLGLAAGILDGGKVDPRGFETGPRIRKRDLQRRIIETHDDISGRNPVSSLPLHLGHKAAHLGGHLTRYGRNDHPRRIAIRVEDPGLDGISLDRDRRHPPAAGLSRCSLARNRPARAGGTLSATLPRFRRPRRSSCLAARLSGGRSAQRSRHRRSDLGASRERDRHRQNHGTKEQCIFTGYHHVLL
jgi:hypothetical protein